MQSKHTLADVHRSIDNDDNQSLTLPEVRYRVRQSLISAIEEERDTVISAPPAAGKSRGVIKILSELEIPALYVSPRHELYQQAKEWCVEDGLVPKILPSLTRHCDTYTAPTDQNGRRSNLKSLYHRGMSPSKIHQNTSLCSSDCTYLQKKPAITAGEDGGLPYVPQREADVLIGHPTHAYVPAYVNNRVVVYDDISTQTYIQEFTELGKDLQGLFSHTDFQCATPVGLYQAREDEEWSEKLLAQLESIELDPWEDNETHAEAEQIARTILCSQHLKNDYSHYSGSGYIGVTDGNHTVYLLQWPRHLNSAVATLCLDAYPMLFTESRDPIWLMRRLGINLEVDHPLSISETEQYIQNTLGISVIQTSNKVKPYSSGNYVTQKKDSKLIRYLSSLHDDEEFPVITAKKAIQELDSDSEDLPVEEWLNFSSVRSNNEFAERDLGLILGSPHYGDEYIKLIAAFMGQNIEPTGKGNGKHYGEIGNVILKNMREDDIAQSILRFGRSEEVERALVYVNTSAIPEYIPIQEKPPEDMDSWISTEAQIRRYCAREDTFLPTTTEITENVTSTSQHVRKVLKKIELIGEAERTETPARQKPDYWAVKSMNL